MVVEASLSVLTSQYHMTDGMSMKLDDQSKNEYSHKIFVSLCVFVNVIFFPHLRVNGC